MTAPLALDWEDERDGSETAYYPDPDDPTWRAQVFWDQYPESPRDMTDSALIEIVTWRHDRHGIGDRGLTSAEDDAMRYGGWAGLVKHLERAGALWIAPVSGIDHSGIAIWLASAPRETSPFDSAGWDSGQWGFAYATRQRAEELGISTDPTPTVEIRLRLGFGSIPVKVSALGAAARAEFGEYAAYVEGQVFGWAVEQHVTWEGVDSLGRPVSGERWESVDSCSGYYGLGDGLERAKDDALAQLIEYVKRPESISNTSFREEV